MRKMSVRYRLLAIALLPTLVIFPILLGATMWRWNAKFDGALISKVWSSPGLMDTIRIVRGECHHAENEESLPA